MDQLSRRTGFALPLRLELQNQEARWANHPNRSSVTCCESRPRAPPSTPSATRTLLIAGAAALLALPSAPNVADAAQDIGAEIFEANCAACHAGGGNVIGFARKKTLKTKALQKYGYDTKESIVGLLREGKGVMPPYGKDKLSDLEVEDVAEFVLTAAERKWK